MAKFKVVLADYNYEDITVQLDTLKNLDCDVFTYQCKTEDDVIAACKDCDAALSQYAPFTPRVIEALDHCKLLVRYGIGFDTINLPAATKAGIYVCNVPDYGIDEVSSYACTLLLACAKKLPIMIDSVKNGVWLYAPTKPLYRIAGKRLGLIGLGKIPSSVAKKMKGFDVEIVSYDPYVPKEYADSIGVKLVDLDELARTSDYISVHCPLTDQTRGMINMDFFKKMKKSAILINTSRGATINEKDLIEALKKGMIACAGLDVLEQEPVDMSNPLLQMPNVIVTSHSAWYTEEAIEALQRLAAEEVVRVLSGNPPRCLVNKDVLKK
jgi:D-3-phosphoglycerate dehydrogenase